MTVSFKYSWEKEKHVLDLLKRLFGEGKVLALYVSWVESSPASEIVDVDKVSRDLKSLWRENKDKFFEALVQFFEIDISELPDLDITGYLVRSPKFPYGKEKGNYWFACPIYSLPMRGLKVAVHEMTHCYFFSLYREELRKEFSDGEIDNIKEVSATILENTLFQTFLKGIRGGFHPRNKKFGEFVGKNIKNSDRPTHHEIVELARKFFKKK